MGMISDWKWEHVFYERRTGELSRVDFGSICERCHERLGQEDAFNECMAHMLFKAAQNCKDLQVTNQLAQEVDLFLLREGPKWHEKRMHLLGGHRDILPPAATSALPLSLEYSHPKAKAASKAA